MTQRSSWPNNLSTYQPGPPQDLYLPPLRPNAAPPISRPVAPPTSPPVQPTPNPVQKSAAQPASRAAGPAHRPKPSRKNKRGAPRGNLNALKHGFYAKVLPAQIQKDLISAQVSNDLEAEIPLF